MVSVSIMMIVMSAMIIVTVPVMSMFTTVSMIIVSAMSIVFVFFFAPHIRLIPRRLDEYLESRVQVYYDEEKYEGYESEESEKKYLHTHDREECDDCRYDEWENEEKERYQYRAEIEENHRIVELHRDGDMTHSHTCRC